MTYTLRRLTTSGAAAMATALMFTATAHASATPRTDAASSVMTVAATLNGSVATDGTPTAYQFQYGITSDYGQSTATQTILAGTPETVPATAALTDLTPNTTYHYRLVTSTVGGAVGYYPLVATYGVDQSFTTDKAGNAFFSFPGVTAGATPTLAVTNGVIPIPALGCASVDPCEGSVTISSLVRIHAHAVSATSHRLRFRKVMIAHTKFGIPAGKSRKIRLKLSAGGRRLLKSSHGQRRATLYVNFTTGQQPLKKVIVLAVK